MKTEGVTRHERPIRAVRVLTPDGAMRTASTCGGCAKIVIRMEHA